MNSLLDERDDEIDALNEKYAEYNYYNGELPTRANDKYELFKSYIGQWHFIHFKYDFLKVSHNRQGKALTALIEAKIAELETYIKHQRITSNDKQKTFLEANHYINSVISGIPSFKNYTVEDRIIYNIILHDYEVYNTLALPDELFDLSDMPDELREMADFYGEYILLYDYLKVLLESSKSASTKKYSPLNSLIRSEYINDFEVALNKLAQQIPENIKEEFRIYASFIEIKQGEYHWRDKHGYKSYLAAFIAHCKEKEWLHNRINASNIGEIIQPILHLQPSRLIFREAFDEETPLNKKYIKAIEKLLK